jgi:hypothetical protein
MVAASLVVQDEQQDEDAVQQVSSQTLSQSQQDSELKPKLLELDGMADIAVRKEKVGMADVAVRKEKVGMADVVAERKCSGTKAVKSSAAAAASAAATVTTPRVTATKPPPSSFKHNLFQDEGMPSFYRRLAWSPEGEKQNEQ